MIRVFHTLGTEGKKVVDYTANTLEELEQKVIKSNSFKTVVHFYNCYGCREKTTISAIDLNKIEDYWINLPFSSIRYYLEIA